MTNDTDTTIPADPRPAITRALDLAATTVAGVRQDQLDLPTPCDEFDVHGLLAHLVFVAERVASFGRGIHPKDGPVPNADRPFEAWASAFRAAADDVAVAWADDALLARDIVLPWTTMTGSFALATYTAEITTHTWDLATATDQAVVWDDDVVAIGLAAMRLELPIADRTPIWAAAKASWPAGGPAWVDPFANAVDVDGDAPLVEQLVAWCGRTPTSALAG